MKTTTTQSNRTYFQQQAEERLGETNINNNGSLMWISKYNNSNSVVVQFEDGFTAEVQYTNFQRGAVKHPEDRTVFGKGYLGKGEFGPLNPDGSKNTIYASWKSMLERVYSSKYQETKPTYKGSSISEEFHNFQLYTKWYMEQLEQIKGYTGPLAVDKDIKLNGNKHYSADTCLLVPKEVNNSVVIKKNPMSCIKETAKGKFVLEIMIDGEKYRNVYDTKQEAQYNYKVMKNVAFRELADKWTGILPEDTIKAIRSIKL